MNPIFNTGAGPTDQDKTLRVTMASDSPAASDPNTTAINANLGAKDDAVATTDTGTFSAIALIKKIAASLTSLITAATYSKGTGILDATTARVTLATDGAASTNLATIATNSALSIPSASAVAIATSDSTNFAGGVCRGVYVGGAGTVVAIVNGNAITFAGVSAGSVLPIRATRINATSTTATLMIALY